MVTPAKPFSTHVDAQDDPPRRAPYIERSVAEESVLDVGRYVRALQRRLPAMLLVAAIAAVLGFIAAGMQRLSYEGVTTLLVVPPVQGGAQINPATFRAIVENASLATQVIDELKLRQQLDLPNLTPHRFVDLNLSVEEIRATNIVKVKVTLPDAQLAAAASRRLAEKAVALTQQITQQEGTAIQDQLKNHLDAAQQRLQGAETALLAYKQVAQIEVIKVDTDADLKARSDMLDLTVNIASERARLAAAEAEIKRQSPLLDAARTPAAEEAMRRSTPDGTAKMPAGVEDLVRRSMPGAKPKMAAPKEIDTQQLDLSNPYVNPVYQTLDFQIAVTRTRIAALEKQRDELINVKKIGGKELTQISDLYRRQAEQARLQATYDLALKVFSDLSVRYEQSRTQPLGSVAQLQIIDAAIPPDKPMSRHRIQQALFGAFAAMFGTALVVVVLAIRRRS